MEELFRRGGFPAGVFQTLLIGSGQVEAVLRDPRVVAATLTGSEPAGRAVAAVAGDEIKPTVLELGGSDPFIVMPSADIERAAEVAVISRCQNNGQSCISAKRFIAHEAVADEFERHFVERMTALRVGDPMVAGAAWGRVRALIDDKGDNIKEAGPSSPVQVLGLSDVPFAGDEFRVAPDDKTARTVAEAREQRYRFAGLAAAFVAA